jgi:hypothetical protein
VKALKARTDAKALQFSLTALRLLRSRPRCSTRNGYFAPSSCRVVHSAVAHPVTSNGDLAKLAFFEATPYGARPKSGLSAWRCACCLTASPLQMRVIDALHADMKVRVTWEDESHAAWLQRLWKVQRFSLPSLRLPLFGCRDFNQTSRILVRKMKDGRSLASRSASLLATFVPTDMFQQGVDPVTDFRGMGLLSLKVTSQLVVIVSNLSRSCSVWCLWERSTRSRRRRWSKCRRSGQSPLSCCLQALIMSCVLTATILFVRLASTWFL